MLFTKHRNCQSYANAQRSLREGADERQARPLHAFANFTSHRLSKYFDVTF